MRVSSQRTALSRSVCQRYPSWSSAPSFHICPAFCLRPSQTFDTTLAAAAITISNVYSPRSHLSYCVRQKEGGVEKKLV